MMKRRRLGRTGLSVSELGVGLAFVADQGEDTIGRGVREAFDLGVNYFDTAPYYSGGLDEQILGNALYGVREKVILATKVGYTADPQDHRRADGLMKQLDESLQRLRTDHVDVIQVHEADFRKWWADEVVTPEDGMDPSGRLIRDDETYDFAGAPVVEFLSKARETGKARFIGITAKDARQAARLVAALDIDTVMIAHQLNPIMRNAAAFLLPTTTPRDLGVLIAAPLMRGILTKPRSKWRTTPPEWMDAIFLKAYFSLVDLADTAGLSLPELTFRWLLTEERQHCVIFGFRSANEIRANINAATQDPLSPSLRTEIDALGIVHPLIFQGRTSL